MDERDEPMPLEVADAETREMLGLFDVPAFARRGQDLEHAIVRLHARCDRERSTLLEMVRLRLRQWSAASAGPDDWRDTFSAPIASLWPFAGAEHPAWASRPETLRRRRAIGRDLVASIERFNRRWTSALDSLDLVPINQLVDGYNRYYLLEKECALGSARVARHRFTLREPLILDELRAQHPELPVPILVS